VLQVPDRIEEACNLLRAEYDGQSLRPAAGGDDVVKVPPPVKGDLVEKAEGGDGDPDRTGRKLPVPSKVELERADVGRPQQLRRLVEVAGELRHVL